MDITQLDLPQVLMTLGAVLGIVVIGLLAIVPSALELPARRRP